MKHSLFFKFIFLFFFSITSAVFQLAFASDESLQENEQILISISSSPLLNLPEELWVKIMKYKGVAKSLFSVNKMFNRLAHSEDLAQTIYHKIESNKACQGIQNCLPAVYIEWPISLSDFQRLCIPRHIINLTMVSCCLNFYHSIKPQTFIEILAICPLKHLNLKNISLQEAGDRQALADAIEKGCFNALQTLELENSELYQESVALLMQAVTKNPLRYLQKLTLKKNEMKDNDIRMLSRAISASCFPALTALNLSSNEINKSITDLMRAIGYLPFLTKLNLKYNPLEQGTLNELGHAITQGHLRLLTKLNLKETDLLFEGMNNIAQGLASGHLRNLKKLNVAGNNLGAEGTEMLMQVIIKGHLPVLKKLNLAKNILGRRGMSAVCHAVLSGNLSCLKEIKLADNELGLQSMEILAKVIEAGHFRQLKSLNLGYNLWGAPGMQLLAQTLASNKLPSLKCLDLEGNWCGKEGMLAITQALGNGHTYALKSLNLSRNTTFFLRHMQRDERKEMMRSLATTIKAGKLPFLKNLYVSDDFLSEIRNLNL